MKDFALDLNNCSKEDRKKSNKAAKSMGFERLHNGIFFEKDGRRFIHYDLEGKLFNYCHTPADDSTIYQMPQDWQLIKEALGIEEAKEEPNDGEVYVLSDNGDDRRWIIRLKKKDRVIEYYSMINSEGEFRSHDYADLSINIIKATPEEEKQLTDAEHAHGWHFDGKDLVAIPEYVECYDLGDDDDLFTHGRIYPVNKDGVIINNNNEPEISWCDYIDAFKPSTEEACKDQEGIEKMNKQALANGVAGDIIAHAFKSSTNALNGFNDAFVHAGLIIENNKLKIDNKRLWTLNKDGENRIKELEVDKNSLINQCELFENKIFDGYKEIKELGGKNYILSCKYDKRLNQVSEFKKDTTTLENENEKLKTETCWQEQELRILNIRLRKLRSKLKCRK